STDEDGARGKSPENRAIAEAGIYDSPENLLHQDHALIETSAQIFQQADALSGESLFSLLLSMLLQLCFVIRQGLLIFGFLGSARRVVELLRGLRLLDGGSELKGNWNCASRPVSIRGPEQQSGVEETQTPNQVCVERRGKWISQPFGPWDPL